MATPRKTATKAEQLRVSQIGDFKARMGGIQELPSGLVVKIKNPGGLMAFIANGTIPNSLLSIVKETLDSNLSKDELIKNAAVLKDDMGAVAEMMQLMDIVTSQVIKEPQVKMVPTEEDVERHNILNPNNQVSTPDELRDDEGTLYIDEIEDVDKQFLFQWVTGGTRDLEKFRKELERNVDAVSSISGPSATSELDSGTDQG